MNWGTLSSNDRLAVIGAALVIIGGLLSFGLGLGWLALLAAIAMLVIVFLPSLSPNTSLPGSKGSLMLIAGAIAGLGALLGLIMVLPIIGIVFGGYLGFGANPLGGIMFFVSVVGGLLMAWAGWQAFQGEGGKFQVGASGGSAGGSTGSSAGSTGSSAGGGTMASTTGASTTTTTGSTPMTSGTTGAAGSTGATGGTDSYGSTGSTGAAGSTGSAGSTGGSDSYGSSGTTGTTDPYGSSGATGSSGTTGTTGSDVNDRTTP